MTTSAREPGYRETLAWGRTLDAERVRPIDALAIARAALREGPETLPAAHLDESAMEIKLLLDHREDIVSARSEDQNRLRWQPGPTSRPHEP